jgi:hypothetical protein
MSTIPTSTPTRPRLTREDVLDGRDVAELLHLPISTVLEYARRGLTARPQARSPLDLSARRDRDGGTERAGGRSVA